MEWLGLSLGVLGIALALIPLSNQSIPDPLHGPILYAGLALLVLGGLMGVVPVWKFWRAKFGPFPFMTIFNSASRLGLTDGEKLCGELRNAAVEGEFKLYGQLMTPYGLQRWLTKIPKDFLKTHHIDVMLANFKFAGRNDKVFTRDPSWNMFGSTELNLDGNYFNLHASRGVLRVIDHLALSPPPPSSSMPRHG